jgi:FkbM family methyltransferase
MTLLEILRLRYRAWRYRYQLDRAEISFLLGHLRAGESVLDIGAHKGAYAYWMCRAVGPTGHATCFEPQPELAAYLRRMKDALRLNQLTVENAGVSSGSGELTLHVPGSGPSPGSTLEPNLLRNDGQAYRVKVVCLDDYFQTRPAGKLSLVKCDVEGHELEVFRGGEKLLKQHRPVLLFECEERHHPRHTNRDVFAFLVGLGYDGFFFSRTGLLPLKAFDPALHGDRASADYVNNFLFRATP